MDPIIGQIQLVGFDWAPRGWALCNGQLLAIASNSALFSLIGVTYGGDGVNTFALPDLRGRVPVHQGQGSGLTPRVIGERSGVENVTLLVPNLPAHTHAALMSAEDVGRSNGNVISSVGNTNDGPLDLPMASNAITPTGNNVPHENMQPYLVMNYIIALEGIYPSRP
jgi:microcystin-dependent protein